MRYITILNHGTANSTNLKTSGGHVLVISQIKQLLEGKDGVNWILNEGAGTKELKTVNRYIAGSCGFRIRAQH